MLLDLPMLVVPPPLSPIPEPSAKTNQVLKPPHTQKYTHQMTMMVLCIDEKGFTLTNGHVSHSSDKLHPKRLRKALAQTHGTHLFFADLKTKRYYKTFFGRLKLKHQTFILNSRKKIEKCMYCKKKCHRWLAVVRGIENFFRIKMDPIAH
ncbi:hypothetical protein HNY73_001646 [Argiope bruennichi]|uniref:Uncharacterized protein n=1 Tax=Argiope bruennichi TaxID=94029 RepID=A0A8T0FVB1_ARGBR|nr:hypothetical protein HNY73_001646 [Argiope bruennichi]